MDNLTHTLVGVTLARTPLGRAGRGATATLVLASNAPDIDIVTTAGGTLRYLQWHRGPTHGPLGVVGLGLVTASLVWAGLRAFDSKRRADYGSYWQLAIIAMVGVLIHVLMDLPTPYGTRLFSPFDWHWYSLDLIPIIDVYLLAVLLAGVAFGSRSEAAGRRSAAIVLAFMLLNYGVRIASHERALALAPRVFGPLPAICDSDSSPSPHLQRWPAAPTSEMSGSSPGACLVQIAALPAFSTPFNWRLVAELSDRYESHDISVLDSRFQDPVSSQEFWRASTDVPNPWTPPVFAAARTEVGQVFLGFARFPVSHASVDPTGSATVRWTEMRFMTSLEDDPEDTRSDFFSATVRLNANGRILDQHLGP